MPSTKHGYLQANIYRTSASYRLLLHTVASLPIALAGRLLRSSLAQEHTVVESLVLVHNIAKRHNVGTMARSTTAFGISEIILDGRRDFNTFGSHDSTSHLRFRHFHSSPRRRGTAIYAEWRSPMGRSPSQNTLSRRAQLFSLVIRGSDYLRRNMRYATLCVHPSIQLWYCITQCHCCNVDCTASLRRCNNVPHLRDVPEDEEIEDAD